MRPAAQLQELQDIDAIDRSFSRNSTSISLAPYQSSRALAALKRHGWIFSNAQCGSNIEDVRAAPYDPSTSGFETI